MKKRLSVLFLTLLLALLLCGCDGAGFRDTLQINWEVQLPSDGTVVYEKDDGGLRDPTIYTVCEYTDADRLKNLFAWENSIDMNWSMFSSDYEMEAKSVSEFAGGIADYLSVPEEFRTDYSACLQYFKEEDDGSKLAVLYEVSTNRLYIIQYFM